VVYDRINFHNQPMNWSDQSCVG